VPCDFVENVDVTETLGTGGHIRYAENLQKIFEGALGLSG